MKRITKILFSFPLMGIILFVFAVSIGIATFIESDLGTSTAKALVYNSIWFEVLLFLGTINILGIIIIHKMYRRGKLTLFVFHAAFVVILIGSAITRFFGFEGVMHIREGETSNQMISSSTYFYAIAKINGKNIEKSEEVQYSAVGKNYHRLGLKSGEKSIDVVCSEIIPNAMEVVKEGPGGEPILELVVAGMEGRQNVVLVSGKSKNIGPFVISLNDSSNIGGVNIMNTDSGMIVKSPFSMFLVNMMKSSRDSLSSDVAHSFRLKELYVIDDVQLIATQYYPSGKIDVMTMPHEMKNALPDALRLHVTVGNQSKSLLYYAQKDALNQPVSILLHGVALQIGYGSKTMNLPFSLRLDSFILARYPGSNSPSWFESKIILLDSVKNIKEPHRIFMNNVLKHQGYRFYQSSYDKDEKGTILSVNSDYWGSLITYIGYILMTLGMVLSIFNKQSRFAQLGKQLSMFREAKKALAKTPLLFSLSLLSVVGISAQTIPDSVVIPKAHAEVFGKILIQDPNGRIKPINSLSSELIRKITRKTNFMGQNSDQVLLGMIVFPEFWQRLPMIKASHPEILKLVNADNNLISFRSLFSPGSDSKYILSGNISDAFNKNPSQRSKFDNELIRFDERANLCYQVYSGELFRIFPKPGDKTHTWYSPENAHGQFIDTIGLYVTEIFPMYIQSVRQALASGKWDEANRIVASFSLFQNKFGKDVLPGATKLKAELWYNKLDLFQRLSYVYGCIGFLLLILQFVSVFKPSIQLKIVNRTAFVILFACFLMHIGGLGLRWYISGHAPWSNGYESMIYIGFATMLAGVIFSQKSIMALAATSLLTYIILFVAHLSWMDPEITNLVPVLKSYWLVIHVAVITASYGFMALGAILAFINLVIMFAQSERNLKITGITIAELTAIIEMTLTVGLYLLTIGTFLGGVWANESWGRYWGWDSKETWALLTVLWYAMVSHFRWIPGLKGNLLYNIMALISFFTVIMTYFGVNYYLSGLHSYAKGDTVPIPVFVYYTVTVITVVVFLAIVKQKMVLKGKNPDM